jgi:hypothetical protein
MSKLMKTFFKKGIDSEQILKELDVEINEFGAKLNITHTQTAVCFNPSLNAMEHYRYVWFETQEQKEEKFDSVLLGGSWDIIPNKQYGTYSYKNKADEKYYSIKTTDLEKEGEKMVTEWDIEGKRIVFVKNPNYKEGEKKPYWNVYRQVK